MNRNIGIHTPDSFRGGLCFPNAQQGNFGQQLTVQIGGLKCITVHHPQKAYANAGKHIDEMPAQTAAANHQNTFAPKQLAFRFAQGGDIARISGSIVQPPPTGGNRATMSPSFTSDSGL